MFRSNRWSERVELFLEEHRGALLLLGALFLAGVVFGAMAVRSLEGRDRLELVQYLGSAVPTLEKPPAGLRPLMLRRALLGYVKLLGLFWVLGVSVVGMLGVLLVTLLRGFLTGFVVAFLAAEMGVRGMLLAAAGHLPQSLLEVPVTLLAGSASVGFSVHALRLLRERRRVDEFYRGLVSYSLTLAILGLGLLGAGLAESYLSPRLLPYVVRLLQAG